MKKLLIPLCALAVVIAGCKLIGVSPAPPTAAERAIFNVVTNYYTVPVIVRQTNVITQFQLQIVQHTNEVGVTVFNTNTVTLLTTNIVTTTNSVPKEDFTLTPKPQATQGASVAGTVANLVVPGSGGIVTTGIIAILAAWAQLRSSKRQDVNVGLTQEIEAMREFIKTLPSGAKYDQAITNFLQSHQVDSNIAQQVLTLIDNDALNPQAKAAVEEINAALKIASGTP